MRKRQSELEALLRPLVEDLGYIFWGMEYLASGRDSLLRIYIDSESGVGLEDCARVSDQASGVLDVEAPITGNYRLEISSPGLDRLLFTPAQYQQFIGETVRVTLAAPHQGRRRITGRLAGIAGDQVMLDEAGTQLQVPLGKISKARLTPQNL